MEAPTNRKFIQVERHRGAQFSTATVDARVAVLEDREYAPDDYLALARCSGGYNGHSRNGARIIQELFRLFRHQHFTALDAYCCRDVLHKGQSLRTLPLPLPHYIYFLQIVPWHRPVRRRSGYISRVRREGRRWKD